MTPLKGTILFMIFICSDQSVLSALPEQSQSVVFQDVPDSSEKKKLRLNKPRRYRRGDTLYYCEVLRLSNNNHKEHFLAVFGYAHILARKGRSKLKIKYVLNRERNYLSRIFYTKASVLEIKRVDIKVNPYMKELQKKYPFVRMWGVLDANAISKSEIVSL
jgi:hypothetical protein